MSIPRLLVALIVMLLAVLLGVLCYLHFANLDRHRNQIEALGSGLIFGPVTAGNVLVDSQWCRIG